MKVRAIRKEVSDLKSISISEYQTSSGKIHKLVLTYQTFGKALTEAPVVLVNHALTGNSTVLGENGWWNDLIGSGKCIDTDYFSVLAFNIPGNGFGGEGNLIKDYKDFVAKDIAEIFAYGLEKLKIDELFAVIGGSVGGGLAWELAALNIIKINNVIPIASDWKSTDWLIANCMIQDSLLNNSKNPLYDARLHAMTLYRTPESFTDKFQRSFSDKGIFNIESWLNHHGEKLNQRFTLSAYKMMNQILKTIDITAGGKSFLEVASKIEGNIHIVTINSDLFFKSEENWKTYVDLRLKKENVHIGEIKSIHGHDAFLIEFHQLNSLLKPIFSDKINELKTLDKVAV